MEPFTVLAVDDQPAILDGLSMIIEIAEGRSLLARSGRDALAIVAEKHDAIALVILDLMPDMTGEVVAYKIREIDPTMPILISSGYDEESLMEQIQLSERIAFVKKPYLIDTMIQSIKQNIKKAAD